MSRITTSHIAAYLSLPAKTAERIREKENGGLPQKFSPPGAGVSASWTRSLFRRIVPSSPKKPTKNVPVSKFNTNPAFSSGPTPDMKQKSLTPPPGLMHIMKVNPDIWAKRPEVLGLPQKLSSSCAGVPTSSTRGLSRQIAKLSVSKFNANPAFSARPRQGMEQKFLTPPSALRQGNFDFEKFTAAVAEHRVTLGMPSAIPPDEMKVYSDIRRAIVLHNLSFDEGAELIWIAGAFSHKIKKPTRKNLDDVIQLNRNKNKQNGNVESRIDTSALQFHINLSAWLQSNDSRGNIRKHLEIMQQLNGNL